MLNASVNSSLPLPAPPADQQQPDTQPSKKKRGARSSLSEDQVEIIQTFFPEMEKLLVKHKLHAGKEDKSPDPSEVSTWFDLTITKILEMNAFENLDKTKKTSTQWRTVIRDVFKNYRNNTFIPKNQKTFALRYLQLENNDPRGPQEFIRAADALVSFKNAAAPKKVFERENKSAILDLMNEKIRQSKESVSPGGDSIADLTEGNGSMTHTPNSAALYQNALTELWARADQQHYTEIESVDIFQNQEMFKGAMYSSLCAFAESGAIGPAEMLLLVGYRDDSNTTQCLRLHAHYRYDPDSTLKAFPEGEEAVKMDESWEAFCEETLPQHPKQSLDGAENTPLENGADVVIRNAAGIPILPPLNLDNITRIQLIALLAGYRKALWDFSYPPDINMPSVPVAHIATHPEDYIDLDQFPGAVQLASIETLNIISLFSLVKYLASVSHVDHPLPLTFRGKNDIQRRVLGHECAEEQERQTGEEILYSPAPAIEPAPLDNAPAPPEKTKSSLTPSNNAVSPPKDAVTAPTPPSDGPVPADVPIAFGIGPSGERKRKLETEERTQRTTRARVREGKLMGATPSNSPPAASISGPSRKRKCDSEAGEGTQRATRACVREAEALQQSRSAGRRGRGGKVGQGVTPSRGARGQRGQR